MIILFVQVLIANWKYTTNCCVSTFAGSCACLAMLIYSTAAFILSNLLLSILNLQLDDLCKKNRLVFRYEISVLFRML